MDTAEVHAEPTVHEHPHVVVARELQALVAPILEPIPKLAREAVVVVGPVGAEPLGIVGRARPAWECPLVGVRDRKPGVLVDPRRGIEREEPAHRIPGLIGVAVHCVRRGRRGVLEQHQVMVERLIDPCDVPIPLVECGLPRGVLDGCRVGARVDGFPRRVEDRLHDALLFVAAVGPEVLAVFLLHAGFAGAERVDEIRETISESLAMKEEEYERSLEQHRKLEDKNAKLAQALEEALQVGKQAGLELYLERRLRNHPQADKIRAVFDRTEISSKEQIEDLLEAYRVPEREPEDLEEIRSRVRKRLGSTSKEHDINEEAPKRKRSDGEDYNGLGTSLHEYRHLAGIRT